MANRISAKCDAGKYSDANNAASCKVCVGKRVNAKQTGCESCPTGCTFYATSKSCKPVDCNEPKKVTNSKQLASARTFGAVRLYVCLTGYEVKANAVGQRFGASIKCLSTSKWQPRPKCSPVECGSPGTVSNSKLSMAGSTVNSTATASCSAGYRGGGIIRCGADGSWSVPPQCFSRALRRAAAAGRIDCASRAAVAQLRSARPLVLAC